MVYDIRKSSNDVREPLQWGREYYARDAMNWLVPVVFVPYFQWDIEGYKPNILRSDKPLAGYKAMTTRIGPDKGRIKYYFKRDGEKYTTKGDIILSGLKAIWEDLPRILRKEFNHNEE